MIRFKLSNVQDNIGQRRVTATAGTRRTTTNAATPGSIVAVAVAVRVVSDEMTIATLTLVAFGDESGIKIDHTVVRSPAFFISSGDGTTVVTMPRTSGHFAFGGPTFQLFTVSS